MQNAEFHRISGLVILVLFAGCKHARSDLEPRVWLDERAAAAGEVNPVILGMERMICLGRCPEYVLMVHQDGEVDYLGWGNVALKGRASGRIRPEQVRELVAAFESARFFDLQNDYPPRATCGASTVTFLRQGSRRKVVWRSVYSDAPPELENLEALFDRVTGSARWVGSAR